MDQDYIDIEAHVRHARQLRNQAMADLISAGLRKCKALLTTLPHQGRPEKAGADKAAAFMKVQYLP
jgi:hypothetical protein